MTVVAFTWQRYKKPLPPRGAWWRADEREIKMVEAAAKHPFAGMSVLDILWDELDTIMDQLMEEGAPDVETFSEEIQESGRPQAKLWYGVLRDWGELRGQAQGIAYAIALCTNPYAADVPRVKAEAKARWDARQK
jgi:hypothetical protein